MPIPPIAQLAARLNAILAEMKRRNLFRVALSYGVVAWLVVQVASTVFPALHVPDHALTLVVVLVLLGFPVSLVLAWAYELTPQGLRRDAEAHAVPEISSTTPALHGGTGEAVPIDLPSGRAHVAARLPPDPTPFVGRTAELEELKALITSPGCRLLTLTGPGGLGKSRTSIQLARQVASSFPNGVCYVPLSDLASPRLLASAVAEQLQMAISGRDEREQLLAFLREKSLLLVLDGFEHLTDGSLLLAEILEQAANVKMVVTSRERLNLKAETVFPLEGLEIPTRGGANAERAAAVQLFVMSARRFDARFHPSQQDLADIVEICRAVDGAPLAIELASAWIGTLTCGEIVREIRRSHDFLLGSQRDHPERHRSLRAVFESSWRMLSDAERSTFARLSVFRGGFNRDEAQRVAGAQLPLLSALLDKSLVHRTGADHYEIHSILRQYAEDRLHENPAELAWTRQLHAAYFADRLAEVATALEGPDESDILADLARGIANLRVAWDWAVQERRADVIGKSLPAMFALFRVRGWVAEGEAAFGAALAALGDAGPDASPPELITRLMLRKGAFLSLLGRYEQALSLLEHGLARARAGDDRPEIGFALLRLGMVVSYRGDYARAERLLLEGQRIFEALENHRGSARVAIDLGNIAFARGEYDRADEVWRSSLEIFERLADPRGVSACLKNLGGLAFERGSYAEGRSLLLRSLEIDRALGDQPRIANSLQNLGCIAFGMGHHEEAERYLEEGASLSREMGARRMYTYCLNTLANVRQAQGRADSARSLYRQALQLASEADEMPVVLEILLGFARILEAEEPERALELLALVRGHPASTQDAREPAATLAAAIEPRISPHRRAAIVERTRPEHLPETVSALLRQPPTVVTKVR